MHCAVVGGTVAAGGAAQPSTDGVAQLAARAAYNKQILEEGLKRQKNHFFSLHSAASALFIVVVLFFYSIFFITSYYYCLVMT